MAEAQLVTVAVRQQVLLERYKAGEIAKIGSILKQADAVIRLRLSGNITALSRARLEAQLTAIRSELSAIYGEAGKAIKDGAREAGEYAAGAEARSITASIIGAAPELAVPAATQIYAAALATPFKVGTQSAGLLEPLIDGWSARSVDAVDNTIRLGFLQGRTNQQIIQDIRGTKANNYQDGVIGTTYNNAKLVTRTAVQHVAQVARQETWKQNADIVTGYRWVSVLDNRTTQQCQALSGQEFKVGHGPLPPIHIGCRSTTAPTLDKKWDVLKAGAKQASKGDEGGKQVDARLTYFEWLKTQPDKFQDAAIGPVRATLLRDGGLTAERFAELSLGKNFEPLTLKQMKEIEPVAFERAGVTVSDRGAARVE